MAIELYVGEDIPDLSVYSIGVTQAAGGSADSDGPEFTYGVRQQPRQHPAQQPRQQPSL